MRHIHNVSATLPAAAILDGGSKGYYSDKEVAFLTALGYSPSQIAAWEDWGNYIPDK